MTTAQTLLAEFDAESRTTRRFLEQLPDDKLGWKPHPKSMTAGQLALHMATFPAGVVQMALVDEAPAPDFSRPNPQPGSTREVLAAFDASIATVRKVLPTIAEDRMQSVWKLMKDGRAVLSIPRAQMLRNILLNHGYHHRGQFGVYLRLVGAKVPSAYGPSGDEPPEFLR
jgi:uncharacterized damage-inducible protein DinB